MLGRETMRYAIGVDAGGTHLRIALLNSDGDILNKETLVVGEKRTPEIFFKKLSEKIRFVAGVHLNDLEGIGLGLPGICNQNEGVIHKLPHYPNWRDIPVIKIMKEAFSCPIVFDNDANMAALGEHWKGATKNFPTFIMLTLGTGIGGGLVLDGKLWRGEEGFAGEVGHMVIEVDGKKCACGNKGCWECYASAGAVPYGKTAEILSKAADAGDKEAKQFWEEFGNYLGLGISNLANITGVEHFVLAGGVSLGWPHFIENAKKRLLKGGYSRLAQKIILIQSTLKGEAALIGCAFAVLHMSKI